MVTNSYKTFKKRVKYFTNPKDYADNHKKLAGINTNDYELFIKILKRGAEILPAIEIIKYLFKISIQTKLTKDDALEIEGQFRHIYSFYNINEYK